MSLLLCTSDMTSFLGHGLRGPFHPGIVTIKDNSDYIRVLLYSHSTIVTKCGVHLRYALAVDYAKLDIFC